MSTRLKQPTFRQLADYLDRLESSGQSEAKAVADQVYAILSAEWGDHDGEVPEGQPVPGDVCDLIVASMRELINEAEALITVLE